MAIRTYDLDSVQVTFNGLALDPGILNYRWAPVLDDRVRPSHRITLTNTQRIKPRYRSAWKKPPATPWRSRPHGSWAVWRASSPGRAWAESPIQTMLACRRLLRF